MVARLPIPGSDDGTWGSVLNTFLAVEHNTDGTLKRGGDIDTALTGAAAAVKSINSKQPDANGAVTLAAADINGVPTTLDSLQDVNATGASSNQVLSYNAGTSSWTAATITSTTISDASASGKGIIQLAGDLGGSNDPTAPTIASGSITDNKVASNAAIAQSKISGLVTSLAAKLDSTVAATTYAPKASPTFSGTVTVPTPVNASDAVTKIYVDAQVAAVPNNTVTVKDEGSLLTNGVTSVDFVGAGVTATTTGNAVTITVPGSGGSGGTFRAVSASSNYTATNYDFVLANATSAGFTVTLPAASNGAWVRVKKLDATANAILVAGQSSATIDGTASQVVNSQYQSQDFMSDGTNWFRV